MRSRYSPATPSRTPESTLADTGARDPHFDQVQSLVAVAGHPVHVMLVTFPIALVCATLGADGFYWWTGDDFFVRVGLWTSGWGFGMGCLAALSGTVEMLLVRGIRRRVAPWSHGVAALMLLSVLGTNWAWRVVWGEGGILPWGLMLSLLGLIFVGLAGWYGGKLVFEHQIGVTPMDSEDSRG